MSVLVYLVYIDLAYTYTYTLFCVDVLLGSLVPRPLPLLHKLGEGLVCDVTCFTSHLMNVGRVNHNPFSNHAAHA